MLGFLCHKRADATFASSTSHKQVIAAWASSSPLSSFARRGWEGEGTAWYMQHRRLRTTVYLGTCFRLLTVNTDWVPRSQSQV